jgi:hypothetical protein
MENQEQNLQITVAYKSGVVTQVPHILSISKQRVSLTPHQDNQSEEKQAVFDVSLDRVQRITLTPWTVSIKVNQLTYSLALSLRNGPWVKGRGGQPQEFTFSKGLQKNRKLRNVLRVLGIKNSDYTVPLSVGFVLFVAVIFYLVAVSFLKP